MSSGKNCEIFFGSPNLLRGIASAGVLGSDSGSGVSAAPPWPPLPRFCSSTFRDMRFFLMLRCAGGLGVECRVTTSELGADDEWLELSANVDSGVLARAIVAALTSGDRVRSMLKGVARGLLGPSDSLDDAAATVSSSLGIRACFSLDERPLVCTKAADRA